MSSPDARTAHARRHAQVATVTVGDLLAVIGKGLGDWRAAPGLAAVAAAPYTVGGWLLAALLVALDMPYLVYPLAMGFALVAPFVAVAFYEISYRRELGTVPTLSGIISAVAGVRRRDLRWMALITAFAFFIWMDIAAMLTLSFFGAAALDLRELVRQIVGTEMGYVFLIVGHVAGAAIAFLVFSISVVSFPMLFHRDVDVMTAIIASVRLVSHSPLSMAVWCAIIAGAVAIALATALLLLPVILPILGFASWHLYRFAIPEGFTANGGGGSG